MRARSPWLIGTLALGFLLTPLPSFAQQPARVPRIGLLLPTTPGSAGYVALREALQELGYVHGRTVTLEERSADGKFERLPGFARELVRAGVDVIIAVAPNAIQAAMAATKTIPIVMAFSADDPVRAGFVASLARPGGNVTGLILLSPDLSAKRLDLLKQAVPRATRLAALENPANQAVTDEVRELTAAARALGVRLQVVEARDPGQLDDAFAMMRKERAGAVVVSADAMLFAHRERIVDVAAKSRWPAASNFKEFAEAGGLMAYGPNLHELFRRSAVFVDRILKGTKPGDLPVKQPMRFELVINLKTAKALGLTIPQLVLFRADQVIE